MKEILTIDELKTIVIKNELYEGDWNLMIEDLENQKNGKQYIFKFKEPEKYLSMAKKLSEEYHL